MSGAVIIIITPPPPPDGEKARSGSPDVAFVGSIPRFFTMLRLTWRIWANWMDPQ